MKVGRCIGPHPILIFDEFPHRILVITDRIPSAISPTNVEVRVEWRKILIHIVASFSSTLSSSARSHHRHMTCEVTVFSPGYELDSSAIPTRPFLTHSIITHFPFLLGKYNFEL